MKCDPHVHSRFSTRPSQWILQKIGCPESFTEPRCIYDTARARGMDLVTIADHNTIEGALSIAHLPGTFVSVEITTYFPEDGCKVHVLALDITEAQFAEIQKIRENIFDLVPFLRAQGIVHVCAHPLYGVNDKLTVDHVERLLLLFKNLELNGAREAHANAVIRCLARGMSPDDIARLADKHGIEPGYPEPWVKHLTGGSDDHSALNIARLHTEVPGATDVASFLAGIAEGRCRPEGEPARPETMAHNLYAIAYQFYKNRFGLERYVNKDIFLRCLDRFLGAKPPSGGNLIDRFQAYWTTRRYLKDTGRSDNVKDVVRREAARLIIDDAEFSRIARASDPLPCNKGREWRRLVTGVTNKVLTSFSDHLFGHLSGGNVFDIFQTIGSAGALYSFLAPYGVAYSLFDQDRRFGDAVNRAVLGQGSRAEAAPRVGHFTDTFFELNGVAKTLQRSVTTAKATGRDLTMVTCAPASERAGAAMEGVTNFEPIGVFDLPEYPEQKIHYPPLLEMVATAYEKRFTHIHAATPGPVGLAALLIARMFKLPIHATYHTQFPQYARRLTGDDQMEELVWRYIGWYYGQMDLVYAPSKATAEELAQRGLPREKIVLYPRGVDTALFNPAKRNGFFKHYGTRPGLKLLYVGRLSREKNLDMLADAFRDLSRRNPELNLVLVGDGPALPELKDRLAGTNTVFTGALDGEELAAAYASSDLFVFPSTTDTFGNVVLEAQASGLPVIVSNRGGPCENVVHGETGLVVDAATPTAFRRAIEALVDNPGELRRMGESARRYMEGRTFEKAFASTWEMYGKAG